MVCWPFRSTHRQLQSRVFIDVYLPDNFWLYCFGPKDICAKFHPITKQIDNVAALLICYSIGAGPGNPRTSVVPLKRYGIPSNHFFGGPPVTRFLISLLFLLLPLSAY